MLPSDILPAGQPAVLAVTCCDIFCKQLRLCDFESAREVAMISLTEMEHSMHGMHRHSLDCDI